MIFKLRQSFKLCLLTLKQLIIHFILQSFGFKHFRWHIFSLDIFFESLIIKLLKIPMKNLMKIAVLLLISIVYFNVAQAQNIASDVAVRLDNNNPTIKIGQTKTIEVKLVRSKYYQKKQTPVNLKLNAPEGIILTLSQNPISGETASLEITTDKNVKPGQYTVYLQSVNNGNMKVSGSILNITVESSVGTATVNE